MPPGDAFLPEPDVAKRHTVGVAATADAAWRAARRLDLSRSRGIRLLFRLRGLPTKSLTLERAGAGRLRGPWSFEVEPDGEQSILATETRVACTDAAARVRFRWYWSAVGPFSGWIRTRALALIWEEAER